MSHEDHNDNPIIKKKRVLTKKEKEARLQNLEMARAKRKEMADEKKTQKNTKTVHYDLEDSSSESEESLDSFVVSKKRERSRSPKRRTVPQHVHVDKLKGEIAELRGIVHSIHKNQKKAARKPKDTSSKISLIMPPSSSYNSGGGAEYNGTMQNLMAAINKK